MINKKDPNEVLAITCYLRSGSGFISSLLDGHPKIITTPDDVMKDFYNFWEKYSLLDYEKLGKKFVKSFNIIFNSNEINYSEFYDNINLGGHFFKRLTKNYGFNNLGNKRNKSIKVDKKVFLKILMKQLINKKKNRKTFFFAVHYAYHKAQNLRISSNSIVAFPIHVPNHKNLKDFHSDFPDAKYICMIRNPVDAFLAQLNVAKKNNYLSPRILFYYLKFIFEGSFKPKFIKKKNWKNIKLEELHLKRKKTISTILSFTKLKSSKKLFFSTWNRMSWHNEISSKRINGFDKNILNRRYEEVSNFKEKNLLEFFLKKRATNLNYKHKYSNNFNFFFISLIKILKPFNFEFFVFERPIKNKSYSKEITRIQKKIFFEKVLIFFKYYLKIRLLLIKELI